MIATETLEAAWAEAEAALREAREGGAGGGYPLSLTWNYPLNEEYTADASMDSATGPTPAAALRALAATLRAR